MWLDGVREPLAVRADAGWGFLTRYRTDDRGEILRDWSGKPETELVYGLVEIRTVN